MDKTIFTWLNGLNDYNDFLNFVWFLLQTELFKAVPFMLVLWSLWFWPKTAPKRTETREHLTAALVCSVPIFLITRLIANYTTFSPRPIHTPSIYTRIQDGQNISDLDGWSSMPSDHASLFFGLAVALFTINRKSGIFLMIWAVLVSSLPRVILGLHWPSDVLWGWIIGAFIAVILVNPIARLIKVLNIVPFFEAREMIGYPLLFLATWEFASMFHATREAIRLLKW